MPLRYYANAPATALTNSCSALATSIVVDSTAGLPITYPYTLIIDRGAASEEAVEVTAAAGTTLTVTRGVDGTTAFAHTAAANVVHGITARDVREPNAHVNADSGVHGVTGDVVGTTDTQHFTNKTAATPATSDDSEALATTEFVKAALLAVHPVGSIKMSAVDTNPGTYLGGTWVAWGSGRVPVGVDAGQAEFNLVEKTGGAKTHTLSIAEMPSHNHGGATLGRSSAHNHALTNGGNVVADGSGGSANISTGGGSYALANIASETTEHTHGIPSQGGGGAHNNLQPYITCYMFKRTA